MALNSVRVQRTVPAPPEAIFDLLADPSRHHELDGSGTVVGARRDDSRRLSLGDSFGMDMNWKVRYATRNVVTEFVDDRVIAWRTLAGSSLIRKVVTGRTWRYELTPTDGGTLVTETWDISTEAPLGRVLVRRIADLTRRNMEATLARIEQVVAGSGGRESTTG